MINYNVSHPTMYDRAILIYDTCYRKVVRGTVDDLCKTAIQDMQEHNFYVAVIWNDIQDVVLAKINRDEKGD